MSQEELVLGDGAIRVFGDIGERLPSRGAWNDPSGWRSLYLGIDVPGEVIAESFLGEQYVAAGSVVVRWDPETGETESTGMAPEAWVAAAREDPSGHAPTGLLQDWERSHGALPVTQRLAPKQPFVLGGEYEVENLYAVDAKTDFAFRSQLAQQIRDLPDGSEVKLRVSWDD